METTKAWIYFGVAMLLLAASAWQILLYMARGSCSFPRKWSGEDGNPLPLLVLWVCFAAFAIFQGLRSMP